ncbi:hypothetical protein [Streptomyces sp. NPDC101455]|uniref:hypothetical protein n=1 Tax=Streptomyces sp. NPDC101455 TaxID=3366142 RepID=UPI0038180B83
MPRTEEYDIDAGHVALWGESAGGCLAALTRVLGGRSLLDPATTDPEAAVQAVVDNFGAWI